jgi:hypothetical protein
LSGRGKGTGHTLTLNMANCLSLVYSDQRKLSEAKVDKYERARQGKEKALGVEHTPALNMVNNLGAPYMDLGKLETGKMYEPVLQGKERTRDANKSIAEVLSQTKTSYSAPGHL